MKPREWYRLQAQAEEAVAELWVYDVIGPSFFGEDTVSAKQLIADLAALPASITTLRVHVNSPGGDVFDAVAIANTLRAQSTEKGRTVEMRVEGLAASAATIVTSAGDSIAAAQNALFMVHNPWALALGEAKDLRAMAEALDTVRDAIIATYRWVSSLSVEALGALMDATTWMSAEEAVANGFATEVTEPVAIAAAYDPRIMAKLGPVPDKYRPMLEALQAKPEAPTPAAPVAADPAEVLALCRAAGALDLAEDLVRAKAPLDVVQARAAAAKEIRALCATAKLPELADGYIRDRVSPASVRAHLTTITARLDTVEIDAGLAPDAGQTGARPTLAPAAIYAARRQAISA